MPSSRKKVDPRRQAFLALSGQIESQLRDAYDRKYRAGITTQSRLAGKLGVNRSAVHHRLMGHTNMTLETVADMVWALDHAIKVEIYDPTIDPSDNQVHPIQPFAGQHRSVVLAETKTKNVEFA